MGLCIISSNESSGKLEKMVLQFMRVQNLLFLLSYFVTETIHVNFLVGMLLNALHGQVKIYKSTSEICQIYKLVTCNSQLF